MQLGYVIMSPVTYRAGYYLVELSSPMLIAPCVIYRREIRPTAAEFLSRIGVGGHSVGARSNVDNREEIYLQDVYRLGDMRQVGNSTEITRRFNSSTRHSLMGHFLLTLNVCYA